MCIQISLLQLLNTIRKSYQRNTRQMGGLKNIEVTDYDVADVLMIAFSYINLFFSLVFDRLC